MRGQFEIEMQEICQLFHQILKNAAWHSIVAFQLYELEVSYTLSEAEAVFCKLRVKGSESIGDLV